MSVIVDQKPFYNDPRYHHHRIHYGAGSLIRTWCRHQYIKGLFPTFLAIWYWILAYISLDYQIKSSQYISDQLGEYNCLQTNQVDANSISCSNLLSPSSQYYYYDGSRYHVTTVSCAIPGVDLYYPNTYYDVYSSNYYIQLIINFIFPLLATYFFYEMMVLALRDCLVIVPGLDKENQPILQYAKKPYRVSWFICHRIVACSSHVVSSVSAFSSSSTSSSSLPINNTSSSEQDEDEVLTSPLVEKHNDREVLFLSEPEPENPHDLPGIRIGRITSIAINIFVSLLLTTFWTVISVENNTLGGSQYRCTKQPASSTNSERMTLNTLLIIYLILAMIPTCYYYIRLFFYIKDIELLAYQYSHEFVNRRYLSLRSIFDIIPLFFFPFWLDIAFWFAVYVPTLLIYYVCQGISYFCCGCCCRYCFTKEKNEQC
jgi:hypothetical protein